MRAKLGALHTEKCFDIAHVGILRQQPLREGQVGWHVGHLHHQHEIGAGRYTPALLNCGLLNGACFKGLQQLFALFVQTDFDQCRDAVTHELPQFVGRQNGHLLLNPAFLQQTLGAAQAGGGRKAQFVGQCNVADAGIGLQGGQQLQVCGV